MKTFKLFSKFSGLKLYLWTYEVARIGPQKWFKMAVYCIKYIHLTTQTIESLGAHFSYNQKSKIPKKNCEKHH